MPPVHPPPARRGPTSTTASREWQKPCQEGGGGPRAARAERGKAGRVRELEKQLDEVRAHYAKKVKDLQKKLDESSREAPPAGQSGLKKDLAHAEPLLLPA